MQNRKDHYFKKAKKENYLARSAYKLKELNYKYKLIKKGDSVLDLGSSPGSWVQVCLELNAERVMGVDLLESKIKDKNFSFIQSDIGELDLDKLEKFDVVLSDMAPNTSGFFDGEESVDLSERAFEIAKRVLKKNGNFLCKVFQGRGFEELTKKIRKEFEFFKISKPKASRKESREMYLIGKNFL